MALDAQATQVLRARADAKLKYSQIHLDLLRERGGNGGADFDRAVQESILFHLMGAKEAFLIELNAYYECGVLTDNLSLGNLRIALRARGQTSPEVAELYQSENDPNCWLSYVKSMRYHSAHVTGVRRAFHMGGENDGKVFVRDPKTGKHIDVHVIEAFAEWIGLMHDLLERLRASAIKSNA